MIKSAIRIIKKILYTRPTCPVDKNWCAHYDGMFCTMDNSCRVLDDKNQNQRIQMSKEIFIVYVTYINCIELMYAFESKENAEARCFELNRLWVNEDSFDEYIKNNKITQISLETYNDYYLEVEDDSYVGINKVVLEP